MVAEDMTTNHIENDEQASERERRVAVLLADKDLKDLLIQRLSDDGHVLNGTTQNNVKTTTGQMPAGNAHWPAFPTQFPFMSFPANPFWGPFHTSPVSGTGMNNPPGISRKVPQGSTHLSGQPGSSRSQGQGGD